MQFTLLLALLILGCAHEPDLGIQKELPRPSFDLGTYRALVEALAADEMEGRGVATEGNRKATEFLERAFQDAGLSPGSADGSYRQCFDHPVGLRAEKATLEMDGRALADDAISPAPFSSSESFEGELVFAGYGIHAPGVGYDDYASFEPKGKVLLLLRFEPREKDPKSPFAGDKPSRYSELRRKVFEARNRGAKAVIFTVPPQPGEEPDRRVPAIVGAEPESAAGLPVLYILPAEADRWLSVRGSSLAAQVAAIDEHFKATPLVLGKARGEVRIAREQRKLCNVIGALPGRGSLAQEALVIGAHFDHLGFGQRGLMVPGERVIHKGADDNASGTAGLLMLVRYLAAATGDGPRRTLIFAAFNAEEVGLAGSSAYVNSPLVPLGQTNAMLNLDMIGRLREDKVIVLGTQSGDCWSNWLSKAAQGSGLAISSHGDGYGPSDQTPFYAGKVPVLHFFTGPHEDHHRSSDDAEKLNYQGAMKVLEVVAAVAMPAATSGQRIVYQETSAGPTIAGDSRGYGAWLGTVPDYTAMSPEASGGVKLSGVRQGGPAEQAGIQGGDRVVSMAGRQVDNLYDMTFVLRDHRPGDVIEVGILRSGKKIALAATLGSREMMDSGTRQNPHGGTGVEAAGGQGMDPQTLLYPGEERHLQNLRQLTFGGENAEGYFSPDGKRLVFQSRGKEVPCDRIYTFDLQSGGIEQVSSGEGRTTCAYFAYPDGESIFYSSTHLGGAACPPAPDHRRGYVWPIFESYDIFLKKPTGELVNLTHSPGYDAEATACFKDGRIVFTSVRDGDLNLYIMDPKKPGQKPVRVTQLPGYDGGAFFSPDCQRLVWRACRPTGKDLEDYRTLLKNNLVRPSVLEIVVANTDGSGMRQLTHKNAASFAPYFLPDNRWVIFASNLENSKGRNFDLYLIDPDAPDPEATLEKVTHSPVFESFPMFSPDGKYLVFASNRNAKNPGDTNLFIAEWVD